VKLFHLDLAESTIVASGLQYQDMVVSKSAAQGTREEVTLVNDQCKADTCIAAEK